MKRLIILVISVIPALSWAFGSVVSDPKSYTYYVKQLEQGIEALEAAEEQIKVATDTYDKVTSVDKKISGNLQRAQANLEKIKKLQDLSTDDINKSLRYAKGALEDIEDISKYNETITKGIEDVFSKDKKEGWISIEEEKRAHRQQAYKQALTDSELAQGKILLQYEQMEELATASNTADSLKDSTDVTNAILLEMLSNQRDMINLLASVTKNISLAFYDGESKNESKKEIPNLIETESSNKINSIFASCSPYDKGCKRKSLDEIMAEVKQSEGK